MANYKYTATIWNFGHDQNGNPIAHYVLRERGKVIDQTNVRREQTGYSNTYSEGPEWALWRITDKDFETVLLSGGRASERINVAFKIKRAS